MAQCWHRWRASAWLVTLAGAAHDYPPIDEAGFMAFVRSLPTPVLGQALEGAAPITPIVGYRRTENLRRHYEALSRYLQGFLGLGDAVCAFNPVYRQGMTVAALGAQALDTCLRQQRRHGATLEVDGLAERFQSQLNRLIATPWLLATGEDFRYTTTEGGRAGLATRLMRPYLDQVLISAAVNPSAHRAFLEVIHLVKPPGALFHANIVEPLVWQRLVEQRRGLATRRIHA